MKEKYSLRDFTQSPGLNIAQRIDQFQLYTEQLKEHKHNSFHTLAFSGVDAHMIVEDPVTLQKRTVVSFISNDYLGMSQRPETKEAGAKALQQYGTGACAAPIIGGFMKLHRELEIQLAEFMGYEDAIIFSSGYGANAGTLGGIMGKKDIALVDSFIHASAYDGLLQTTVKKIGHNDLEYLELNLKRVQNNYDTVMLIADGVYSQNGDLGMLPEYIDLCRKYGAFIMVDDAHGIGVFGENGKGTTEHLGVLGKPDMVTGTLSKSFGCVGGFVVSSRKMIDYLRFYGRTSVFSAAPTPQATASALKALELIRERPEIRAKLWDNVRYMKSKLLENGFDIKETASPIFPIMVRDNYLIKEIAKMLLERGFYTIGICYPAVSNNDSRIRASVLATHTKADIDGFVNALNEIDAILDFKKQK